MVDGPLQIGPAGWIAFNAFILAMLALDLGVFHRKVHAVRAREAAIWTGVWIALALAFCGFLYARAGSEIAVEFLTGYLIEKSLSVDNVFVMVIIFSFFSVPARLQHRVLFWGVLGALVMRGIFVALGSWALHRWEWILYVFGAFLVITAIRMVMKPEEEPDLERNWVVRLSRRFLPITGGYREHHFLVKEAGRWMATPLLLVLLTVEVTDLIFAVDSIPAIFAITADPFIVYTSNVFAILGLRSLYFILGDVVHRFVYLKYGLAFVLAFIGVKMLFEKVYHVPTTTSLAVIGISIGASVALSLWKSRKHGKSSGSAVAAISGGVSFLAEGGELLVLVPMV